MKIRIIPGAILAFLGLYMALSAIYGILTEGFGDMGVLGNTIMAITFLLPGIPLLYTGLKKEKPKT